MLDVFPRFLNVVGQVHALHLALELLHNNSTACAAGSALCAFEAALLLITVGSRRLDGQGQTNGGALPAVRL